MVRGLVLIRAPGRVQDRIVGEAKEIKGVWDAYPVFGRFDVVVFIRGKSSDEAREAARKVKTISGILSTETLLEGE